MRKRILGIWLACLFIFGAVVAYGVQCTCVGHNREYDIRGSRYATAFDELRNSDTVFVGEVVETKKIETPPISNDDNFSEYETTFKVKRVWKNDIGELVAVRQTGPCLIGFNVGEEYLVYVSIRDNVIKTYYCSRTRVLAKAAPDLKEFEEKGEKQLKINREQNESRNISSEQLSATSGIQPSSAIEEIQIIPYCSLIRDPRNYDEKTIRLRTTLSRLITLEAVLHDTRCKTENGISAAFDEKDFDELYGKIYLMLNSWETNSADVVVMGKLKGPPANDSKNYYGHMGRYKYQFLITGIESIERISTDRLRR